MSVSDVFKNSYRRHILLLERRYVRMKKILKKRGIMAVILGILFAFCYFGADTITGGIDNIGAALVAAVLVMIVGCALLLNLFLMVTDIVIYLVPDRGKVVISYVLLALYVAALLYFIYDAFAFSYGEFFSWLAEGEFFSLMYVLIMIVLVIMIAGRLHEIKKLRKKLK